MDVLGDWQDMKCNELYLVICKIKENPANHWYLCFKNTGKETGVRIHAVNNLINPRLFIHECKLDRYGISANALKVINLSLKNNINMKLFVNLIKQSILLPNGYSENCQNYVKNIINMCEHACIILKGMYKKICKINSSTNSTTNWSSYNL